MKNVALAAKFIAVDDGKVVNMNHVLHTIRREHQKIGKALSPEKLHNSKKNEKL